VLVSLILYYKDFSSFLNVTTDLEALVELGRSFHQQGKRKEILCLFWDGTTRRHSLAECKFLDGT